MSHITGPEGVRILADLFDNQYNKRDINNIVPAYQDRLNRGDQDPAFAGAGCGDSFCIGLYHALGINPLPNIVFTGDNPGNALITRLYDSRTSKFMLTGTPSTAYFVKHIAGHGKRPNYFLFAEGHTMCGAMDAILGNAYQEEEAGLYEHLKFMHEKLRDTLTKLDEKGISDNAMKNALLAQTNVDVQVHLALDLYKQLYPEVIDSGKLYIIGMMRDITGNIYAPETPMIGDVFMTNLNGVTDVNQIQKTMVKLFKGYSINKEVIKHNVRRLDF